jgi:hypothetical protein
MTSGNPVFSGLLGAVFLGAAHLNAEEKPADFVPPVPTVSAGENKFSPELFEYQENLFEKILAYQGRKVGFSDRNYEMTLYPDLNALMVRKISRPFEQRVWRNYTDENDYAHAFGDDFICIDLTHDCFFKLQNPRQDREADIIVYPLSMATLDYDIKASYAVANSLFERFVPEGVKPSAPSETEVPVQNMALTK